MNIMPIRSFAIDIARQAGQILKDHYATPLDVQTKSSPTDLVTQADLASEACLIQAIRQTYPEHAILAEESGAQGQDNRQAEYCWLIDPLDGTTNFVHYHPIFSLTIALLHHNELILGLTFDPLRDELFIAEKGQGAVLNGVPIQVSQTPTLSQALIATGFPYEHQNHPISNFAQFSRVLPQIRAIRRSGSAALDLAYVACGRLDGYWEFGCNAWDWLGGVLLVRESGGVVTDTQGHPPGLDTSTLLAANSPIHQALYSLVQG